MVGTGYSKYLLGLNIAILPPFKIVKSVILFT